MQSFRVDVKDMLGALVSSGQFIDLAFSYESEKDKDPVTEGVKVTLGTRSTAKVQPIPGIGPFLTVGTATGNTMV